MPCWRLKPCTVTINWLTLTSAAWTSTEKLPLALLPAPSVALHVTVVVPIGNMLPDAREHVTARPPLTLSAADAEYVTIAPCGLVASTVMLPGRPRIGLVVSTTVTCDVASLKLPAPSVARHV